MIRVTMLNIFFCLCRLLTGEAAFAAEWSEFRGPHNDGRLTVASVPVEWSADSNIAWKMPLPGAGNGSPIVSGGRVFVTSAENDGRKRHLHCFHAEDGTAAWVRTVEFDRIMPTHKTNRYGGTTPAADGERIVVWHSSAGLFCYDFEGTELWSRDLGDFRHQWGYGTSPIIDDGRVYLHSGPGREVFIAAFELVSGRNLWTTPEPVENDGERNDAGQYMGSWSTPLIGDVDGRRLLVCSMATRVNAYNPETGQIELSCDGLRGDRGDLCYASPVIAGDICVAFGGFKGPRIAFRMKGAGNITEQHRLWRFDRGNPQRIGSGVLVDDHVYIANAGPSLIQCIEPESGDIIWEERSPGAEAWGSMVYAGGRIYTTDQEGTTHVLNPSPSGLNVLASNPLGEPGNSTPAVAAGRIYLRTFGHLWCVAE